MHFIDEKPFAPYFIFIKGINEMNDKDVLELLDLGKGNLVETTEAEDGEYLDDENCTYIYKCRNWVHIMDSWFYSLYHSQKLRSRIEELGKSYEIFTCSVGDSDRSFDFRYFKNGEKVREYIVDSPNYNDQIVRIDFGSALSSEKEALQKKDESDTVLHIAESLGVQLPKSAEGIKCYKLEGLD
ncbi:MAG: hypothetical protein ACI85I_001400 [Arenicella sp.]|jgi:hypothetical protein